MNSQQGKRYIKHRMGDELKNKILERHGIKIVDKQQQMVSRTCGRCNYVNKLENKYCERVGCNYPLTDIAFQEIKAAEQSKMQELINKSNLERDNTIEALLQEMRDIMISYKLSISEGVRELIKQDGVDEEELKRLVKIILQVVPRRKRGASGIVRLTPEEDQKVRELMNQQKS